MIAYVQQIVRDLIDRLRIPNFDKIATAHERLLVLVEELNRLDPRDFAPADQYEFVDARLAMRLLAKNNHRDRWSAMFDQRHLAEREQAEIHAALTWDRQGDPPSLQNPVLVKFPKDRLEEEQRAAGQRTLRYFLEVNEVTDQLSRVEKVLDSYGGTSGRAVNRSFAFVVDQDLRCIIERDYRELVLTLLPGEAWKSAVVMAGSIMEALLYDRLTQPATLSAAMAYPKAPTKKGGAVRDLTKDTLEDAWSLEHLIEAAVYLNILRQENAQAIHQTLRDYRNFVHPKKELRVKYACGEGQATAAKGMLEIVIDSLS